MVVLFYIASRAEGTAPRFHASWCPKGHENCFVIINLAPGSPIQQKLAEMRFGGAMGGAGMSGLGGERGDQGVTEEVIAALKRQYGFDKPLLVRYGI